MSLRDAVERLRVLARGFGRRGAAVLLLAIVAAAGAWSRWAGLPDLGPWREWDSAEERGRVADFLNETVRLEGFSAVIHTVRMGENFWGIASENGTDIDTIVGCNPSLSSLGARIDQPLLVVNTPGCLHVVQAGDTLSSVAEEYGVKAGAIRKANVLPWFWLRTGRVLFIPGAAPKVMMTPGMRALYERRALFRSPLAGAYTSLVGWRRHPVRGDRRHHAGVDIRSRRGQPAGAAADGTVVFAGSLGTYGKCVKISHGNGYMTVYGHLSRILVKKGEKVVRHQFIGRVGSTGLSTGPHLHFEIRLNGRIQDPLDYLW